MKVVAFVISSAKLTPDSYPVKDFMFDIYQKHDRKYELLSLTSIGENLVEVRVRTPLDLRTILSIPGIISAKEEA